MLRIAFIYTLLLTLQTHTGLAREDCKHSTLQELREIRDSSGEFIYVLEDGFVLNLDERCYEAKYDLLSEQDKEVYQQVTRMDREKRIAEGVWDGVADTKEAQPDEGIAGE